MKNHRPESTDEQLEHHSLPGTNMAGKGPAEECDQQSEQDKRKPEGREHEEKEGDSETVTENR